LYRAAVAGLLIDNTMKKSMVGKKYLNYTACKLFQHGCCNVLNSLMLD
jgi:hypothetical protein